MFNKLRFQSDQLINLIILLFLMWLSGNPLLAWSAAKPSPGAPSNPSCSGSQNPSASVPVPVRKVIVQPVGTKAFHLPNGVSVNLAADLQSLLNTAITSTSAFSPTDAILPGQPGYNQPCDSHIEIRAAVTTFQLDIAQFGVSVGYTPGGTLGPISSISGKTDVKIGTIAMDFSVWECTELQCSAVAASHATHLTAGVNLALQIDFSGITTGPNFIFNTPLGDILRKIMTKGMNELAASPRLNELTWKAVVKEYIPSAGIVIFDAGSQARLGVNQSFEIYAVTDATSSGVCNVFKTVAYVHTTSVDSISSTGVVDKMLDSRGIQVGDIVMVRPITAL